MGIIRAAAHAAEHGARDAVREARTVDYYMNKHVPAEGRCAEHQRAAGAPGAGTVAVLDGKVVDRRARRAPQTEPVNGAEVLDLVRQYLARYIAWPSAGALNAAVAWVVHAVSRDRDDTGIGQLIWRASPRLLATSRTRGSGKSTLLDLIAILTGSRGGKIPKITPRAIAEALGEHFETVCLDEARTIFGSGSKSLELQGILLAGYTPRSSYRIKGKIIPLFGAVAFAGKDELITDMNGSQIGDLLDRSIIIRMRPPATVMPEVDEDAEDYGEGLAALLVAWTDSVRAELRQAAKDLAAEDREAGAGGNLRTAQIWRPLKAIGRIADGPDEHGVYGPGEDGTAGRWEESITDAEMELTVGAASTEAQDALAELQRRAQAWGAPAADDEPGEVVTDDSGDYEDE